MAADQKGARDSKAWIVFFDESAISLTPVTRRTWAPRGQTPILRHRFAWKRASMAAALGYRADGTGARLCFDVHNGNYDTPTLIGVLERLADFYAGQQVVLLWDGLSAHWSRAMRTWLQAQQAWLTADGSRRMPLISTRLKACGPTSRPSSWPTSPATTWSRSPTRPNTGSSASAPARVWSSGSLPIPVYPWTNNRHPNP